MWSALFSLTLFMIDCTSFVFELWVFKRWRFAGKLLAYYFRPCQENCVEELLEIWPKVIETCGLVECFSTCSCLRILGQLAFSVTSSLDLLRNTPPKAYHQGLPCHPADEKCFAFSMCSAESSHLGQRLPLWIPLMTWLTCLVWFVRKIIISLYCWRIHDECGSNCGRPIGDLSSRSSLVVWITTSASFYSPPQLAGPTQCIGDLLSQHNWNFKIYLVCYTLNKRLWHARKPESDHTFFGVKSHSNMILSHNKNCLSFKPSVISLKTE